MNSGPYRTSSFKSARKKCRCLGDYRCEWHKWKSTFARATFLLLLHVGAIVTIIGIIISNLVYHPWMLLVSVPSLAFWIIMSSASETNTPVGLVNEWFLELQAKYRRSHVITDGIEERP